MTLHEILTYCIENSVSIPRLCQQKRIDHLTIKRQLAKGCESELYAKYKKDIVRIYSSMKRRKKGCGLIVDIRTRNVCPCGCGKKGSECAPYYINSLRKEFGLPPIERYSSIDTVYAQMFRYGL